MVAETAKVETETRATSVAMEKTVIRANAVSVVTTAPSSSKATPKATTAQSSKATPKATTAQSQSQNQSAMMHQMATKRTTRQRNNLHRKALAAMIMLLVCLGSCQPKHTDFTEFRHIPACGWLKESPLHFTPSYADSTHRYNISLAVRHDSEFTFSNLSMTIDIFGNDSIIERKRVNLNLADSAGNWLGSGFGALYQLQAPLRAGTRAGEVTKIVVWQSLDTDTLSHLTEVGIILK